MPNLEMNRCAVSYHGSSSGVDELPRRELTPCTPQPGLSDSARFSGNVLDGRFAGLLDYIRVNLAKRLSVSDLARHSSMSPRHFARLFRAEVGVGPAKAVERLRVEAARAVLVSGTQSNQRIARSYGFGTAERMRRSFQRVLATSPASLKSLKQLAQ